MAAEKNTDFKWTETLPDSAITGLEKKRKKTEIPDQKNIKQITYTGETEEAFREKLKEIGMTKDPGQNNDRNIIYVYGQIPEWMSKDYCGCIITAATLKNRIDRILSQHGLDSLNFTNWKLSIVTDYYATDHMIKSWDINSAIERSIRKEGYLRGRQEITDNIVIRPFMSLEEVTIKKFIDYLTTDILLDRLNKKCDFEMLPTILQGISFLRDQLKDPYPKYRYSIYKSNIPYGRCDGGIFAITCEDTGEIVVIKINGSY